jgi:hypothetical protein
VLSKSWQLAIESVFPGEIRLSLCGRKNAQTMMPSWCHRAVGMPQKLRLIDPYPLYVVIRMVFLIDRSIAEDGVCGVI